MRKHTYTIQKGVKENGQEYFKLLKDELVVFTGKSEFEIKLLLNSDGFEFNDEEILRNIHRANKDILIQENNKILAKYESPSQFIDGLLVLLIILSLFATGFLFIFSSSLLNFGRDFSYLTFMIPILFMLFTVVPFGAILNSRKRQRNILDRLDEVEKQLNMYQKGVKEVE